MIIRKRNLIRWMNAWELGPRPCREGIKRLMKSGLTLRSYIRKYYNQFYTRHGYDIDWLEIVLNNLGPSNSASDIIKILEMNIGQKK